MKKLLIGLLIFALVLFIFPAAVYADTVNITNDAGVVMGTFTKEVSPDTVVVGEEVELTYTYTVTNTTNRPLINVVIADPGFLYIKIGFVRIGDSAKVTKTKTVTPNTLGKLTNTATVTGGIKMHYEAIATATVNVVANGNGNGNEEPTEPIVEPKFVSGRTHDLTCWQIYVNEDRNFEFIFWYEYANNNWVSIYDMEGSLVYIVDFPHGKPVVVVDLPDGMYIVRTFHAEGKVLQEFVIGK